MALNVKLSDIYNGKERKMRVTRNVICGTCSGTGSKMENRCRSVRNVMEKE